MTDRLDTSGAVCIVASSKSGMLSLIVPGASDLDKLFTSGQDLIKRFPDGVMIRART